MLAKAYKAVGDIPGVKELIGLQGLDSRNFEVDVLWNIEVDLDFLEETEFIKVKTDINTENWLEKLVEAVKKEITYLNKKEYAYQEMKSIWNEIITHYENKNLGELDGNIKTWRKQIEESAWHKNYNKVAYDTYSDVIEKIITEIKNKGDELGKSEEYQIARFERVSDWRNF